MDEPTVVTRQEPLRLFETFLSMTRSGISAVLINHQPSEVMESDGVTVLRKDKEVATVDTATSTTSDLNTMIVGCELKTTLVGDAKRPGDVVLSVDHLTAVAIAARPPSMRLSSDYAKARSSALSVCSPMGRRNAKKSSWARASVPPIGSRSRLTTSPTRLHGTSGGGASATSPAIELQKGFLSFNRDENLILRAHRSPHFLANGFLRTSKTGVHPAFTSRHSYLHFSTRSDSSSLLSRCHISCSSPCRTRRRSFL
jgi:hypothetical protein